MCRSAVKSESHDCSVLGHLLKDDAEFCTFRKLLISHDSQVNGQSASEANIFLQYYHRRGKPLTKIAKKRVTAIIATSLSGITFHVVLSLGVANAVIKLGPCASVASQATLDPDRYVGKWYELKRFPNINQMDLRCTSAQYTLASNGSVIVRNQGITSDGTLDSIEGTAQVVNVSAPAELSVDFGFGWPADIPNYYVLATDYDSYSLVYSCSDLFGISMEYAWILSRERNAGLDVSGLEQILTDAGVDITNFETVDQQNCSDD
ncbi:apolipoprotein D [Elysia marginata]|uniref:Apolipoprotein D n=1 Tax=Elysia marginata TaxID=1093978 RepID=A0AAV4IMK3_9GAST|nr:apolipoprotein D [Elysia marginata]